MDIKILSNLPSTLTFKVSDTCQVRARVFTSEPLTEKSTGVTFVFKIRKLIQEHSTHFPYSPTRHNMQKEYNGSGAKNSKQVIKILFLSIYTELQTARLP